MTSPASCVIDFSTAIRNGAGAGVLEDGTVDACVVQRSYLRAWCRAHPDSPLTDIVGHEVPDDEPSVSRVLRAFACSSSRVRRARSSRHSARDPAAA